MTKQFVYVEPDDYFPEEIQKKYGLGKYNEDVEQEEQEQEEDNEEPEGE